MEEAAEELISCCIICLQNIAELKPSIDDGNEGGDSEDLKAALDLFGSLLNNGGTTDDKSCGNKNISDNGRIDWTVCCGGCSRILGDIMKLEEMIKQNRVWQMEHVKSLKNLIVQSALGTLSVDQEEGRFWRVICDLIIERLNSHKRHRGNFTSLTSSLKEHKLTRPPMSKRSRGRPRTKEDNENQTHRPVSFPPGNVQSCSVGLHRLSRKQIQQYTSQSAQKIIKIEHEPPSPVLEDCMDYAGSPDKFEEDEPPPNKKRKERNNGSTSLAKANDSDSEGNDDYSVQLSDKDNFLPGSASDEDEYVHSSQSTVTSKIKTQSKKRSPKTTAQLKSRKKNKFECETCGKAFPARRNLEKHMGTHLPMHLRTKYVCPVCAKKMVCMYSLKEHMEHCHQTDWSQLDKNSIVVEEGSQDNVINETRQKFKCETCGKNYSSRYSLKAHLRTHVPGIQQKFLCPLCDLKMLNKQGLQIHLKNAHHADLSQFDTIAVEEGYQDPNDKTESASKVIKNVKVKSVKGDQYSIFNLLPTCDNFLMYKYTVIKHDYNQRLTCQEPGCSFSVEETDCDAVQGIRDHIQKTHWPAQSYRGCSRVCPLCLESFDGVSLRRHIGKCHGDLGSICDICWKPMNLKWSMKAHVWTHKNEEERAKVLEKETEAGVIPKELAEKATIEKGWKRCFPRKPVGVTHAQEEALEAEQLEQNRQKEKSFMCQECGKRFYKLCELKNHAKTHLPKEVRKYFTCPYCDVQLLNKISLQGHIIRRHKPETDKYLVCYICDKKFSHRYTDRFQSHMRKHTGEKPFQCEQCGKGFVSNGILICHRKVHEEARPFQCEYCPMNFKQKSTLKRHRQRAHKDIEQDPPFTGQSQPEVAEHDLFKFEPAE